MYPLVSFAFSIKIINGFVIRTVTKLYDRILSRVIAPQLEKLH